MADLNTTILVIILGILVGIAYSLRRIFILEKKLNSMEKKVLTAMKRKRK